jgi:hypothetical protein
VDQVGVSHASRKPSLRFQVLPTIAIFKDGCLGDWIKWVMAFRWIEKLVPLNKPTDKTRMLWTLLKGQALSYFEHHLRRRVEAEDLELSENELLELVLRYICL